MRYDEPETAIHRLADGATDDNLRAFGADTVVRLTGDEILLDVAIDEELDGDAAAALGDARANVLTAGPSELRARRPGRRSGTAPRNAGATACPRSVARVASGQGR